MVRDLIKEAMTGLTECGIYQISTTCSVLGRRQLRIYVTIAGNHWILQATRRISWTRNNFLIGSKDQRIADIVVIRSSGIKRSLHEHVTALLQAQFENIGKAEYIVSEKIGQFNSLLEIFNFCSGKNIHYGWAGSPEAPLKNATSKAQKHKCEGSQYSEFDFLSKSNVIRGTAMLPLNEVGYW